LGFEVKIRGFWENWNLLFPEGKDWQNTGISEKGSQIFQAFISVFV
jgi:hypothetical protein